jgi:hypothetical protein
MGSREARHLLKIKFQGETILVIVGAARNIKIVTGKKVDSLREDPYGSSLFI